MKLLIKTVLVFLIIFIIFSKNNELFDGYGKSFGYFYHPIPKCQVKNNCFAGSYVKNIPYNTNTHSEKYLNCCIDKHLKRDCHWKKY